MKAKFKLSSEWIIFIWCLLIATLFWFLRILNDNYTTSVQIPVTYSNLPENETFVHIPPDKINIIIQGPGWDLMSLYLKSKKISVNLDLNQYSNLNYFIPNQNLNKISVQLPVELQIVSIIPDTIFITTDQIIEKKLTVYPDIKITTDKQFGLSKEPVIYPESILVSGPKSILNSIDTISTVSFKLENLNHSTKEKVPLIKIKNVFLNYEQTYVELNVQVEKLTEKSLVIPVKIKNIPKGMDIILIPSTTQLSFQTTLSNFDKIGEIDFEVYVNAEKIDTLHNTQLEIQLKSYSPFVYSLKAKPNFVSYLIQKLQ